MRTHAVQFARVEQAPKIAGAGLEAIDLTCLSTSDLEHLLNAVRKKSVKVTDDPQLIAIIEAWPLLEVADQIRILSIIGTSSLLQCKDE